MNKQVKGKTVDNHTRCIHYHSETDVIAIKFKCCNTYFSCFACHQELTNHSGEVWTQNEFEEKAILCGMCETELSINEYLSCNNRCPKCNAQFNPNCRNHYHLYFEIYPN